MVDAAALHPLYQKLLKQFNANVQVEERANFFGLIVEVTALTGVLQHAKEKLEFDYLSSITAADDFPEDRLEIIYHLYRSVGGPELELKVFVARTDPHVPSAVPLYPGAEFQEREVYDLFGVTFDGHPDLRRILMWDGFDGHPLRKDWKEPQYEDEVKPFKSRWPEGKGLLTESRTPYNDNVQYPAQFDPHNYLAEHDQGLYEELENVMKKRAGSLKTDQLIVNLGPQHPSTHGVFRMIAVLDGETIVELKPAMGYLHRNHEKIGERNTFLQIMPYTDRLDYLSSMNNNFGYAVTIERMMGIQPPPRAEYIRVMMAELTRIASHIWSVGFLLNDLGAYFTPALYAMEERELILDIFEAVAGSRMMCNYFRFGGLMRDVDEALLKKARSLVFDRLPRKIDELDRYLTDNEIIRSRCEGVGVLTAEQAIAYSITGPLLRSSGVPYDIRRADPYGIYDQLDFDVCIRLHGDVYDRYLIRLDEMRQSLRILRQVLDQMPEGPVMTGKVQYNVRVPAGEMYGRVEGPRGELGYYVVSDGKPNPKRYHVRAPSLVNLTGLAEMCRGAKIADAVTILGSVDIVLGEVDR
jgi:NADH:ubiquinone oxidoreductase subunit D/NADH:ubiquinone oxidoreductase subunit C